MKTISLRQPWAWLVFHGKDIENRSWPTKYRGPLLIHASKNYDRQAEEWLARNFPRIELSSPLYGGMIIGKVNVVDCVTASKSRWFFGPYGFVLKNPIEFERPIPFKGRLGIFEVPDKLLGRLAR